MIAIYAKVSVSVFINIMSMVCIHTCSLWMSRKPILRFQFDTKFKQNGSDLHLLHVGNVGILSYSGDVVNRLSFWMVNLLICHLRSPTPMAVLYSTAVQGTSISLEIQTQFAKRLETGSQIHLSVKVSNIQFSYPTVPYYRLFAVGVSKTKECTLIRVGYDCGTGCVCGQVYRLESVPVSFLSRQLFTTSKHM